jgi:hypothetical protein
MIEKFKESAETLLVEDTHVDVIQKIYDEKLGPFSGTCFPKEKGFLLLKAKWLKS